MRAISNEYRFKVLELTASDKMSITKISSTLKLSYTKCADYIRLLEKEGLVGKTRVGKEVFVESRISFSDNSIRFA